MTSIKFTRALLALLMAPILFLSACKPTYKKETLKESVKELAKKEYKLDVEVKQTGRTIGVRYRVNNLFAELVSEDQQIWKQVDDLMLVLSRITLSADVAPDFFVLEISDVEHPNTSLVFTRYSQDVKKLMADGLSRNQYLDRLLIEFVIGSKHIDFDPNDMDMVRLMMMTMESGDAVKKRDDGFVLDDVDFHEFLGKVAANYMRRLIREKHGMEKSFQLREVSASFNPESSRPGTFKVLLDLVSQPAELAGLAGKAGRLAAPNLLELKVLPLAVEEVEQLFHSYRFSDFTNITVVEKNSGKVLTVAK